MVNPAERLIVELPLCGYETLIVLWINPAGRLIVALPLCWLQAINCKDRALLSVQVELKYISPVYTLSSLIKIVQSVQGVVDVRLFLKSPGYRLYFPGSRPHLAQKHCPWNLFYYCGFIGVIITSKILLDFNLNTTPASQIGAHREGVSIKFLNEFRHRHWVCTQRQPRNNKIWQATVLLYLSKNNLRASFPRQEDIHLEPLSTLEEGGCQTHHQD